jgi:hypothetical protein
MRVLQAFLVLIVFAPSITPAGTSADAKLDAAEMQWRTKAPATYEFTITFHEMIIREGCSERQFHATVAHSIPSRRTDCAVMRTTYSTVPKVFKEMRKMLSQHWPDVSMEFDPVLGYPREFYIGDNSISDSYFGFTISKFFLGPAKVPN